MKKHGVLVDKMKAYRHIISGNKRPDTRDEKLMMLGYDAGLDYVPVYSAFLDIPYSNLSKLDTLAFLLGYSAGQGVLNETFIERLEQTNLE